MTFAAPNSYAKTVMNENHALLADFLAEPENPAACLAYAAWLEKQHDPRGEYLRLRRGLEEPKDINDNSKLRRLFELRQKIDDRWATQVDRTCIATGGVYQSDTIDGAWHYLRFYPDGSALSLCSGQTPSQAWQRLQQPTNDRTLARGVYKLFGDELRLSLVQEPSAHMYNAWKALFDKQLEEDIARDFDFIAADGAIRLHAKELAERMKRIDYAGAPSRQRLRLNWHRPLDDSRGTLTYQFAT